MSNIEDRRDQVLKKLEAREKERRQQTETKNDMKSESTKDAVVAFLQKFERQKANVEEKLAELHLSVDEKTITFDEITNLIQNMQKFVSESAIGLSSYECKKSSRYCR